MKGAYFRERGFKSQRDYQDHLARRKGFDSSEKYEKYLERVNLFKEDLIKDKGVRSLGYLFSFEVVEKGLVVRILEDDIEDSCIVSDFKQFLSELSRGYLEVERHYDIKYSFNGGKIVSIHTSDLELKALFSAYFSLFSS